MADAEIEAMAAVGKALETLEAPARERVLRWALSRFEIESVSPRGTSNGEDGNSGPNQKFSDLGDLMHAADPSNGPERALTVAYWFQQVQRQDGWTGADINSSLKNMGSGLANVTNTLNSLKARKPALVMQTSKSGRSQQARKTYKLTVAGLKEVQRMLAEPSSEET
ncbi:MAG: hypothetical protein WAW96_04395 [Alphaproteobacteria bacterium]